MALNTSQLLTAGWRNIQNEGAGREAYGMRALAGVTGTVHLLLVGGGTLTGTVDTTALGDPDANSATPGGYVKVTDSNSVVWVVPLTQIVAAGQ